MIQRLQKIMSQAGIASRRKSEELIKKGLVKVNGKTMTIGDKADPKKDKITINNKPIKVQKKVYIILNKPKGILSTVKDDKGRKTVIDLINPKEKIFPVGRLDFFSEGLMILTNDGDFANSIMHPSYNVKKTYLITLNRALRKNDGERIRKGISLEERKVNVFGMKQNKEQIILTIHEGRKHVIRDLFAKIGYSVLNLKRIAIGNLALDLKLGEHKYVRKEWLKENIFASQKPKQQES